jgi:hypothetical protein
MTDLPWPYWLACIAGLAFAFVFLRPRHAERRDALSVEVPSSEAEWVDPPEGTVAAYGFGAHFRMVPIECHSARDAEALARDRNAAADQTYQTGEEAMWATAVGFTRSDRDFIEVNCFGGDRFEVRAGGEITGADREQAVEGTSLVELMRLIEAYYAGPAAFAGHWAMRSDRKDIR